MKPSRAPSALALGSVALALWAGCGGAATHEPTTPDPHANDHVRTQPDDGGQGGMQITGLLGTLSREEIQGGIDSLMPRFESCFADNLTRVELLSGHVVLSFRIAEDGSVRWVFPSTSNVGDVQTEQCLDAAARRARFPRPHGGEAEFTFPLDYPLADDVRPPSAWEASRVDSVVAQNRAALVSGCSLAPEDLPVSVTVIVDCGGAVRSAGVSVPRAEHVLEVVPCVAQNVSTWRMPDPGSYPAKVTFEIR